VLARPGLVYTQVQEQKANNYQALTNATSSVKYLK